jgi:hypothetical protein
VGEEGHCRLGGQKRRLARVTMSSRQPLSAPNIVPNTRSELALPLVMGRTVLGVLDIQSDQAAAFAWVICPFSSLWPTSGSYSKRFLYQSEKTRRQLAETLYEVSRALSAP